MTAWKGLNQPETDGHIDALDVADLLISLTEKSLIARDDSGRYRLLESVREYGRGLLTDGGEVAGMRSRHLHCFLALAEEAEPHLTGSEQQLWLERLEAEHDNLRAALEWGNKGTGKEAALRLAGAIWRFWSVRGYLGEGRGRLSGLLRLDSAGLSPAARVKLLTGAGGLAKQQSDLPSARAFYEDSLTIQRELGDQRGIAHSLRNLGTLALSEGDYPSARALYEESLAIRRELGDRQGIANSLNSLGTIACMHGEYAAARALYQESIAIDRELGDRRAIAYSLNNLGNVAHSQGDYLAAHALHEESLTFRRELGDRQGIAGSLSNLGDVAFDQGDYSRARALHMESLAIQRELGDRWGIAYSLEGLSSVMAGLNDPAHAARLWGTAERLREEIGAPLPPFDRLRYDQRVAAARTAIGAEDFNRTWQEGRAMTVEQAIALALKNLV